MENQLEIAKQIVNSMHEENNIISFSGLYGLVHYAHVGQFWILTSESDAEYSALVKMNMHQDADFLSTLDDLPGVEFEPVPTALLIEARQSFVVNSKQKDALDNILKSLDLFWYNTRYVYSNYLLTHILFMLPHLYVTKNHAEYHTYSGYFCIIAWFAFGFYKTKQPGFLWILFPLFFASQVAFNYGFHNVDTALTITCVVIMFVKQYLGRYEFADRIIKQDLHDLREKTKIAAKQ